MDNERRRRPSPTEVGIAILVGVTVCAAGYLGINYFKGRGSDAEPAPNPGLSGDWIDSYPVLPEGVSPSNNVWQPNGAEDNTCIHSNLVDVYPAGSIVDNFTCESIILPDGTKKTGWGVYRSSDPVNKTTGGWGVDGRFEDGWQDYTNGGIERWFKDIETGIFFAGPQG